MNGDGGGSPIFLIILGLAVVALLFMSSRARKRQNEATAFRTTLAAGQQVMTSSGMFGTVVAVDGDKVTLVSSGGQESQWLLAAIAKLVDDEPTEPETAADDDPATTEPGDDTLPPYGTPGDDATPPTSEHPR